MGVGTDIGGSIRIPAAYCGVYGHRPTTKRLPMSGLKMSMVIESGGRMLIVGRSRKHYGSHWSPCCVDARLESFHEVSPWFEAMEKRSYIDSLALEWRKAGQRRSHRRNSLRRRLGQTCPSTSPCVEGDGCKTPEKWSQGCQDGPIWSPPRIWDRGVHVFRGRRKGRYRRYGVNGGTFYAVDRFRFEKFLWFRHLDWL